MKKVVLIGIILFAYTFCFSQIIKVSNINFFPMDSSFYIQKIDKGHLGFPDLLKLKDNSLVVVYRQGEKHVDSLGKIMINYGSVDGKTWSKQRVFFDIHGIDERDASLTLLPNGDVGVNYFHYVKGDGKVKPTIVQPFWGVSKDNCQSVVDIKQVTKGALLVKDMKEDNNGYWTYDNNLPLITEGVSSPAILLKNKLILPSYGGVEAVKTPKEGNEKFSRISLFVSDNLGKTWTRQLVNPEKESKIRLQEPFVLNIDNQNLIMHIRTQTQKKYSPNDKMMQSLSYDGGETWSDWTSFDFIGHAPYLYKLKCGVIISAFRILDSTFTLEGSAFMWSLDNGQTWSKPLVFDKQRKDNDSSYPSITELDNNQFLIVYYTENGKAIKGRIFRYEVN